MEDKHEKFTAYIESRVNGLEELLTKTEAELRDLIRETTARIYQDVDDIVKQVCFEMGESL
jgi:hypothetical protein